MTDTQEQLAGLGAAVNPYEMLQAQLTAPGKVIVIGAGCKPNVLINACTDEVQRGIVIVVDEKTLSLNNIVEPVLIKNYRIEVPDVIIANDFKNQKPWYAKFDKKRGKRRK